MEGQITAIDTRNDSGPEGDLSPEMLRGDVKRLLLLVQCLQEYIVALDDLPGSAIANEKANHLREIVTLNMEFVSKNNQIIELMEKALAQDERIEELTDLLSLCLSYIQRPPEEELRQRCLGRAREVLGKNECGNTAQSLCFSS